jgi:hypothetical protein
VDQHEIANVYIDILQHEQADLTPYTHGFANAAEAIFAENLHWNGKAHCATPRPARPENPLP